MDYSVKYGTTFVNNNRNNSLDKKSVAMSNKTEMV